MNFILKQLIIVVIVFCIILWVQNQDDKKNKRIRTTLFEQYKLPILVASLVGFIINLSSILYPCIEHHTDITIIEKKLPNCTEIDIKPEEMAKPFMQNLSKEISEQQIYTELPDF
jgi:hypothetical protein